MKNGLNGGTGYPWCARKGRSGRSRTRRQAAAQPPATAAPTAALPPTPKLGARRATPAAGAPVRARRGMSRAPPSAPRRPGGRGAAGHRAWRHRPNAHPPTRRAIDEHVTRPKAHARSPREMGYRRQAAPTHHSPAPPRRRADRAGAVCPIRHKHPTARAHPVATRTTPARRRSFRSPPRRTAAPAPPDPCAAPRPTAGPAPPAAPNAQAAPRQT